jgi:CheY-like chemotaxis protein
VGFPERNRIEVPHLFMSVDKHPYTILAIEDNPGDFVLITEFLEERIASNKIYHAPDFKTATQILAEKNKILDVILLDLSLPDKYSPWQEISR